MITGLIKRKKYKVLYLFISHQKDYLETLNRCIKNYKDFLVVVGGEKSNYISDNTLYLNVDDNYEGLPQKVLESLKYIAQDENFSKYTHICKLDSDMKILKKFSSRILAKEKYFGKVQYVDGKRDWGKQKFTKNSKFSKENYSGPFVPWCLGGYGYVVSIDAVKQILHTQVDYDEEPYEDLLISKLLVAKNVAPYNFKNLNNYIYSSTHNL